jgi:GTP-binding protein Era
VATCLTASAAQGTGVSDLEAWLVAQLPPGPTLYPKDQVSEHPERFFVAEIVRERIFEQYHQEVPYSTTVSVVEHRERGGSAKDFIAVVVSCERDSQVPILLGKGGAAIKELSQSARTAIEAFLGRPVFLEISVKVAPGWRDSDDEVERYGINNASKIA